MTLNIVSFLIMSLLSVAVIADSKSHNYAHRVDSHAPIGVMADHGHKVNEVMASVRYMSMSMGQLYQGNSKVNAADVSGYTMVPESMYMSMMMIGAMAGVSERLTLMSMIGVADKSMTATGMMKKSMSSSGLTDMKMSGLYTVSKNDRHVALAELGINLPLGSIEEKDGGTTRLAYPMQLGSGTYDIQVGSTYTQFYNTFSFGGQLKTIVRTGKNSNGYRLGNQFSVTAWLSKILHEAVSVSARVTRQSRSDIEGADTTLMETMSPTNSTNTGFVYYNFATGMNIQLPKKWKGLRIAMEYTIPIYQHANNVQLGMDDCLTVGSQYLF